MSRNRWFIRMIVLLMFIILAIAYTVFITGQDPEPRRVSVIVDDSGSARWNLFREGVREAAEDQGLTVNVVSTDGFCPQRFGNLHWRDQVSAAHYKDRERCSSADSAQTFRSGQ